MSSRAVERNMPPFKATSARRLMYWRSFCISRWWNSYSIDPDVSRRRPFGRHFPISYSLLCCNLGLSTLPYSSVLLIHAKSCQKLWLFLGIIISLRPTNVVDWPPTAKFLYFFLKERRSFDTQESVCEESLLLLRITFCIRINKILIWLWKLAAGAHSVRHHKRKSQKWNYSSPTH